MIHLNRLEQTLKDFSYIVKLGKTFNYRTIEEWYRVMIDSFKCLIDDNDDDHNNALGHFFMVHVIWGVSSNK